MLSKYGIMDSAAEADFDDLTRIAARFCDAPIALVSLLDEHRQWFKSRVGVNVTETARDVSYCHHAIQEPNVFVVSDAAKDVRFANSNVFPDGPPIRFYAGAPLITPEGTALGTLCIMDYQPREPDEQQLDVLRVLGRQVMSQLELRRRNSELGARERLLFTILESEGEGIVLLDADGLVRMVNRAGLLLLNLPDLRTALGKEFAELLGADDRVAFQALMQQVFDGESPALSLQLAGEPGGARWVVLNAAPVRNDRGQVVEAVAVMRDVTERRYTREERDKLMLMIEHTPELISIADLQGRVTFMNTGGRAMIGLEPNEKLDNLRLADYLPTHWQEALRTEIIPVILDTSLWEGVMQLRHLRTGELIDIQRTMFLIRDAEGQPKFIGGIATDISARVKGEQALRASEERYRALFDYAPDGIVIADSNGVYRDANASLCAMLGYSREELIGLDASSIVEPEETQHIQPALQVIRAEGDYQREWRFRRKDGGVFSAEVIARTMPDGNILAMFRDVTERNRVENRFRRLVESNAQGVIFWNLRGAIVGANDAFLEMTGYTRDELERGEVNWMKITPPEYAERDRIATEQIAVSGSCTPFEKEYIRKDGTRIPVLLGAAKFQDSSEEGVSFVLDLTERKKLEQQFLRAQRMESIGTLAGGIAHDLNNVLGPIVMAIDLLKLKFSDADSRELLDIIGTSALRGADMVRQVLSFARGVEGRRMEVQLRHLVRDLERIITETLPKNIAIAIMLDSDLWSLNGEPTQLHQVLMNLCVNARDAMPEGGRLTISASNHELDAQYVAMNPEASIGRYVLLQVEDTGTGIPPHLIEKIFDPFFTTKPVGKGTGLGLSTSGAIVKSHGGFIRVYSEPGKGTKFKVYLPALLTTEEGIPSATPADPPRGNGEVVLVIDDEVSIRQITQQTLEAFGYRVVTAVDGADAVAKFAVQSDKIAVVVTDMMMPVMDGPATIQVLRRLKPNIPVIAVSGLSTNGQVTQTATLGVRQFLPKPYTAEALLNALHAALNETPPR